MSHDPALHAAPGNNGNTGNGPGEAPEAFASLKRLALSALIAGVALYLVTGVAYQASLSSDSPARHTAQQRFATAFLTSYIYWLSLPIGAMTLLMISYLVKSSWGVLLRRFLEAATRTFPLFVVLFIPWAYIASTDLSPYWWTKPHEAQPPEGAAASPQQQLATGNPDKRQLTEDVGKAMIRRAIEKERELREKGTFSFLSLPAFIGTAIVLFAIWGTLIYLLNRWGQEASTLPDNPNNPEEVQAAQDKVDAALEKLKNISGPGIIIYALTMTAGATHWVMSLEPSWSSTMFPVVFGINQFLTCFALCLASFLYFSPYSPIREVLKPKFQLDMGSLMLAMTLLWSYTSFSQFMLVWIGNLPEEIPFYLKRSVPQYGLWWWVSVILIFFHFALPFVLLLFRKIKLHPVRLRLMAIYLCVICAIDVTWWIEPVLLHEGTFPFWLMDVGAIVGLGGLWGWLWLYFLQQRSLVVQAQTFWLPEAHAHVADQPEHAAPAGHGHGDQAHATPEGH
ncbi:MAG: hypothetical protein N3E46_07325 [Gemmataceae bacterium]|nr:hypothetical protein [Gemmataceae bacterium]